MSDYFRFEAGKVQDISWNCCHNTRKYQIPSNGTQKAPQAAI